MITLAITLPSFLGYVITGAITAKRVAWKHGNMYGQARPDEEDVFVGVASGIFWPIAIPGLIIAPALGRKIRKWFMSPPGRRK